MSNGVSFTFIALKKFSRYKWELGIIKTYQKTSTFHFLLYWCLVYLTTEKTINLLNFLMDGYNFFFFLSCLRETLNLLTDGDSRTNTILEKLQDCFCGEAAWLFSFFLFFFHLPLPPPLPPARGSSCPYLTSLPFLPSQKKLNLWPQPNQGGGVSRLVVIALRFFFLLHAPNLFVYFEKVPKHILFTRLTQYITCLQKYETMYRRFVKSGPTVSLCFLVTISNVFYKIFFKPYSTTISLIKQSLHKKT